MWSLDLCAKRHTVTSLKSLLTALTLDSFSAYRSYSHNIPNIGNKQNCKPYFSIHNNNSNLEN